MHYLPIDKHYHIKSFIHALDPRVKIISLLIYVVTLVSTRPEAYISFLFYGLLLLLLLFLSKIPPGYVLKRSMVVMDGGQVVAYGETGKILADKVLLKRHSLLFN